MAKFATAFVEIQPDLSKFGSGLGKEIEARLSNLDVSEGIERNIRPKFSGIGKDLAEAIKNQTGPEFEKAVAGATDALNNAPRRQTSEVDLDIRRAQAQAAELRAELADLGHTKATPEVDLRAAKAKLELDEIQVRLAHLRSEKAEIKVDVDRSSLSQLGEASNSIGQAFRGVAVSLGGLLGVGGAFTGIADAAAAALPVVLALSAAIAVLVSAFAAAAAGAGVLGVALAGALGPAFAVLLVAAAKIAQIIKAIHDDGKSAASSAGALASAQDQLQSATDGVASAQDNLRQQTTAAYQAWADSIEAVHKDLLDVADAQLGIEDAQLSFREATLALKEFKAQVPGLDSVFKKFTDVNVDLSGLHGALEAARKSSGGKLSEDDTLKLERLILNVRKAKLGEAQATDRLHNSNTQLARDRQTETKFATQGIRAYPGYAAAVRQVASAERQRAAAVRAVTAAQVAQAGEVAKLSPIQQKLAATFKNISKAFNLAFSPALNALFTGLNRALIIFSRVLTDPRIVRALAGIGKAMGGALVTLAKTFSSKKFRDGFIALSFGAQSLIKVIGNKAFPAFADILLAIAQAALPALVKLVSGFADQLDRWAKWIDKHPAEFNKHIGDLIVSFEQLAGAIIAIGGFLIQVTGFFNRAGHGASVAFTSVKHIIGEVIHDIGKFAPSLRDVLTFLAGAFTGNWKLTWSGIKGIARGALRDIVAILGAFGKPFASAGTKLAHAFSGAFRSVVKEVKTIARTVASAVFEIIRSAIKAINSLTPGPLKVGGHTVIPGIPDIKVPDNPFKAKPKLNTGNLPTLTKTPSKPRASASAAGGETVNHYDITLPPAPKAAVPDARYQARQLYLEIAKAGG